MKACGKRRKKGSADHVQDAREREDRMKNRETSSLKRCLVGMRHLRAQIRLMRLRLGLGGLVDSRMTSSG